MGIEDIRKEIDSIDGKLIELFSKRMSAVQKVAEIKFGEGLPIFNLEREKQIREMAAAQVPPDVANYADSLYSYIFELSRCRQREIIREKGASDGVFAKLLREKVSPVLQPRVVVQGVEGAYSSETADILYPGADVSYTASWEQAVSEVENGEADYAVLPIENSAAGSVLEVYDLLLKYNLFIVKACPVYVNHCLLGVRGTNIKNIRKVYTHPHAFPQCKSFFSQNHRLEKIPYINTALAAKMVAQEGSFEKAAIASRECAHLYGLDILAESIQDCEDNCTRFVAVSKRLEIPEEANKISIAFTLPHVAGSLYRLLSRFALNGINVSKIESRPNKNRKFEYFFYLDFASNLKSRTTMNLLSSLQEELPSFTFFGNYYEKL